MAKQPEPDLCPVCGTQPMAFYQYGNYTTEHLCAHGAYVRGAFRRTWPGAVNAWNRWASKVKEKQDG